MDALMDAYDVVVVGGGAAGLNGALILARSRRSVVVIDSGTPRNAPSDGVHGLLGHDGTPPRDLYERGRSEVRGYGGQVVSEDVIAAAREESEFVVTLADGRRTRTRRLLVATGLIDELPDLPGVRDRWGHDVLHCPYCHGWEVRDQTIGILATGPRAMHQAMLFRQLSDDITYFSHTAPPNEDEAEQLAARNIRVVDGRVTSLEISENHLAGVRLAGGVVIDCEALVVMPKMVARASFLRDLGLALSPHPSGLGDHVPVDATGRTDAAGIWAAGNVTDIAAQVGASAAAGALAAAQINADLVAEDTDAAVDAYRRLSAAP